MARRKTNKERVEQEKIKDSLEAILANEGFSVDATSVLNDLPDLKNRVVLDFKEEKAKILNNANSLLNKMVDFYLDNGLIGEAEHIEYKKTMDASNLASMILQLKTSQHTIIKLVEEIDLGNLNPSLINSLVALQTQVLRIPKDYQEYISKMESSYKRMKEDYEQKKSRGGVYISEEGDPIMEDKDNKKDGKIRVRGNKSLMENLRDIIGTEIEDVTLKKIDDSAVVNAREKLIIDSKKNKMDKNRDEEEIKDIYDSDEDVFNI